MERGYVKLWRKSLDSSIFTNPKIWFFWTYCLMKATHKKYKPTEGFQQIELEPGQFIFGRKKASEETGLSEQNIRTCLKFLEKSKNLTIKPTNKFSIISITNWDTYQPKENESNQQSNQQVTNNQPTSNHKQEQKNIKKEIYTSNFESFWETYPKKVGKGLAFKNYKNIREPKPSLQTVLSAIEIQNKSTQWQDKQFIPHPSTWLSQRRWEDEPEEPMNGTKLSVREILEKHGL
jgi:predicted transcriptional regulator